ncbi:hypothetical protein ABCW43_19980 [Neorhizobium sp. IRAMC:178]|uniref:hypothetical protein n=1 Tax=Neorhizobium tunisiense TaxID=3144793 RepID=UPI0031F6A6EE
MRQLLQIGQNIPPQTEINILQNVLRVNQNVLESNLAPDLFQCVGLEAWLAEVDQVEFASRTALAPFSRDLAAGCNLAVFAAMKLTSCPGRTFAGGMAAGRDVDRDPSSALRNRVDDIEATQRPRHIAVGDDVLSAVTIRAYRCDRHQIRRHPGRNPGAGLRDTGDHRQISSLRSTCFDASFGRCRTITVSKDDFRAPQAASLVYARFRYGPDGNDPRAFDDRRACHNETV